MISMPTISIILVIVLIIFGGGKLPEIGAALGKGIKDFKKAVEDEPAEKAEAKLEASESKASVDGSSGPPRG
jgi:sec-independent protein translocase protein TatA